MKKFNTTLLIITTAISVFFFLKWVNDVRPRYEIKKEIFKEYGTVTGSDYKYHGYVHCNTITVKNENYIYIHGMKEEDCDLFSRERPSLELPGDNFIDCIKSGEELEEYMVINDNFYRIDYEEKEIQVCYKEKKVRIK